MSENHEWLKVFFSWSVNGQVKYLCFQCAGRYKRCERITEQIAPLPHCEDCGDDYNTANMMEIGPAP